MTKDVISLSISVLLIFRHYISHKITFGAPSSGGVFCSACGAFIVSCVSHAFANVHCCLVVTCWERADLLSLVGDVYCICFLLPHVVSWVRCGT